MQQVARHWAAQLLNVKWQWQSINWRTIVEQLKLGHPELIGGSEVYPGLGGVTVHAVHEGGIIKFIEIFFCGFTWDDPAEPTEADLDAKVLEYDQKFDAILAGISEVLGQPIAANENDTDEFFISLPSERRVLWKLSWGRVVLVQDIGAEEIYAVRAFVLPPVL